MTTPQTKSLDLILDEEVRYLTHGTLHKYTISSSGKVFDPNGEEITPRLYRGKPTVSVNGFLIFLDHAICKLFCKGYKRGMTIGYKDGDKTNVDASNLFWRPRLLPKPRKVVEPEEEPAAQQEPTEETQQPAQEPTAEETKESVQEPEQEPVEETEEQPAAQEPEQEETEEEPQQPINTERWIRRYDRATCQLVAEYHSWGEAIGAIQHERPHLSIATIRPKVRQALRYGYTVYGSLWRASSPSMLGRGVSKGKLKVMSEPPTQTPRPQGWIRCYGLDGQLVAQYKDLDECISDIASEKPASQIAAQLRLAVKGYTKTFMGLRWEVSDLQILNSRWGQLSSAHPRSVRNTPQTAKECEGDNLRHPTRETLPERTTDGEKWIKRYNGHTMVAEYKTLEEAVEAVSSATILTPVQIATRIRQAARQDHCRSRYLGCYWSASGEDALQWENGEPPKQLPPQPTESVEPMEPQPTDTPPSKPSPSQQQTYEVEVETDKDVEVEVGGVVVTVRFSHQPTDSPSRARICVRTCAE